MREGKTESDGCEGGDCGNYSSPCDNLISALGGAVALCAKKLNPKGEQYILHGEANILYQGKEDTFYGLFKKRAAKYGPCEQLMGAFILLSLATGNPHAAVMISKKMFLMNTFGGTDFAF